MRNCESQPSSSANTDSMTIKETTMKQPTPKLTKDLHLRLNEDFQNELIKIANENNLSKNVLHKQYNTLINDRSVLNKQQIKIIKQ